jgi:hypothetical protein
MMISRGQQQGIEIVRYRTPLPFPPVSAALTKSASSPVKTFATYRISARNAGPPHAVREHSARGASRIVTDGGLAQWWMNIAPIQQGTRTEAL